MNEYVRESCNIFLPIYVKLFNLILVSGHIPESLTVGIIKPLYKSKGAPTLPENYQPITILSCMGKLLTAILNSRLNNYLEENKLLNELKLVFVHSIQLQIYFYDTCYD